MENKREGFIEFYEKNNSNYKNGQKYKSFLDNKRVFFDEVSLEKLRNMSLKEYVIGTKDPNSFCYNLEFGKYKTYGPGIGGNTANKYGIYYSNEKRNYLSNREIENNPEEKWSLIKNDLVKVLESVGSANNPEDIKDDYDSLKGMGMVICKLAVCFYPDKLVPYSGRKHITSMLDILGINYNDEYSTLQLLLHLSKEVKKVSSTFENEDMWVLGNSLWDFYATTREKNDEDFRHNKAKVWMYAPGSGGDRWDEFYKNGIMALGWDELGNLDNYASKSDILEELKALSNDNKKRTNDALANYEFSKVMKIGDVVYAKKGNSIICGMGIVESDYYFDDSRTDYKSVRKVKWLTNEEKNHKDAFNFTIVQKTLTELSRKYPDYVKQLESLYDNNENNTMINDVIKEINTENTYTKYDFLNDAFITEEKYDTIINTLKRKKNIILQGVPGVGKTYIAKKIMQSMMSEKNESRIKTVQFHQSYSYEDFIEGFRPNDDGKFELKQGIFLEIVNEARKEYEAKGKDAKEYCIIIDEINRGNLSKVFGELMMLIEGDKRNQKWSINLTYSDEEFYIPENLYIIGTMNTADRSLAMIDYALRRRFAFITLDPAFENEKLKEYLINNENIDEEFVNKLIHNYRKLNEYIEKTLGRDFLIGHSYFINQFNNRDGEENAELVDIYNDILEFEVIPLLKEYYYDDLNKVEEAIEIIRNI